MRRTGLGRASASLVSNKGNRFYNALPSENEKNKVPRGFWKDVNNQRAFLDKVGQNFGVKQLSDWYTVPRHQVNKACGSLLWHYESLEQALVAAYPEHPWKSDRFQKDSNWGNPANQRAFLDRIGKELGVMEYKDWFDITRQQVEKKGRGLFCHYASLEDALRTVYPEHPWPANRFLKSSPRWDDVRNHKTFLSSIAPRLGVKEMTDWYGVTRTEVEHMGGRGLFMYYNSLEAALRSIYPDVEWDSSKFAAAGRTPVGHWKDANNLKHALDRAEEKLGITKPEDWYSVTMTELREVGSFPSKIGKRSLAELLMERYPNFKWEVSYLLKGRYAQQKRLEKALSSLFPGHNIISNARQDPALINPDSGNYLELDVFIPALQLAFEYQEAHHYTSKDQPVETVQERDTLKQALAKDKGITLVTIPFWWDGKLSSLAATIDEARPGLLPSFPSMEMASPIPVEMPPRSLDRHTFHVEGVGEPLGASFLTHSQFNPEGWWLFEKYDGIRGFWNPTKRAMYSRLGNQLPLPSWIVDAMPYDTFLDGELWFGREKFQESLKVSSRANLSDIDWTNFKYMVFDVPNQRGTFQERYSFLENYFAQSPSTVIEVAPKEECNDMTHMEVFFQDVVDKGGEGIILRDPRCPYEPGRSRGFLKHKKFRDAEAKIVNSIGHQQWECELPNGVRFTAVPATTQFAKRWNPKAGDIVSFKHHGYLLASKKPKLPTLFRLRPDLSWDDVVHNWKGDKPVLTVLPRQPAKTKIRPKGYWSRVENRQRFLNEFAKELGFDPTRLENWKRITARQIQVKHGGGLISSFGGSLRKALQETFPAFASASA